MMTTNAQISNVTKAVDGHWIVNLDIILHPCDIHSKEDVCPITKQGRCIEHEFAGVFSACGDNGFDTCTGFCSEVPEYPLADGSDRWNGGIIDDK